MAKYSNYHQYKHQFKETLPKVKRLRLGKRCFTPPNEYKILIQKIVDLIPKIRRIDRLSKKYQTNLKAHVYSDREFSIANTSYLIAVVDGNNMLQTRSSYDDGVYSKMDSKWTIEREYESIVRYIEHFFGEDEEFNNIEIFFGNYSKLEKSKISQPHRYLTNDNATSTSSSLIYGRSGVGKSFWMIFNNDTEIENYYTYK